MKIICNRIEFLKSFQVAAPVAPAKSNKDVLTKIKLEASDDGVVMMATDADAGVRVSVEDVEVVKTGSALLDVIRVGSIFRESRDEFIHVEVKKSSIHIIGDAGAFCLPAANPDEFPSVVAACSDDFFEIDSLMLLELIKRTQFAIDCESTRYQLGGVCFSIDGESITAVATDGRRMAVAKAAGCNHGIGSASLVVPSKTLRLVEKSFIDGQKVRVSSSGGILFSGNGCEISSRLIDGRFPDWTKVIPVTEDMTEIRGGCGSFFSAIKQASIVADPESRGVSFAFSKDLLVVAAKTADVGQSRIETPIDYVGDDVAITMDYRFVGDFFRVLDSEKQFSVFVKNNSSPAVFSTDDGYTYVVMPMSK